MKSILLFLVITIPVLVTAQQKPASTAGTAPLTYTVSLGGHSNADVPADLFRSLIDSALVVKDNKGNRYTVTRFRINYTFSTVFTDSETQQRKEFRDFRAADFYDTDVFPEPWRGSIRDNAKKGDVVLINNVIIRLKNGKKLMVPDLRGTLK